MAIHDPRSTVHGFFVTGTDTAVGKTLVACALLKAFAERGLKVVGMKPVASGAEWLGGDLVSEDVERLIAASNTAAPRERINPYCFAPPIAPHIAAREAGVTISLDRIEESFRALAALADVVVVEGIGGFRVPLGADGDTSDLAARLALPLVLVVGLRLGCLNHALLTAESIRARGLRLAAWVANHIDPAMAAAEHNIRTLEQTFGAPPFARIAYSNDPDPVAIAMAFEVANLR